jgi:hypothetical protein
MNNRENASLLVDASQFKTTITVKGFFVESTFSTEWVNAGTKKHWDSLRDMPMTSPF